jgi:hypothetical protein
MRKKFEETLYTALGEASMCWSETPTGVFQSEKAKAAGERVMAVFNEVYSKPWLGNATTEQLLDELHARALTGGYLNYRTVDQ